jgi:prolyl-tRNA synthetase
VEKAEYKPDYEAPVNGAADTFPIERIATPTVKTIVELCAFLKTDAKAFIKTLIYRAVNVELDLSNAPGSANLKRVRPVPEAPAVYAEAFFAVCIRGDLDVNEAKLAAALKAGEVALASDADVERFTDAPVGFIGPVGLTALPVVADKTVTALHDAVTGALEKDIHYRHVAYGRDVTPWLVTDIRTVKVGDRCPVCGGELYEKKGNELGHIFKLGYKYTTTMNVHFLDENGVSQTPIMGCYGIGVDRTLASVIEEHHDDVGIVWTISVAPFHVIIVPVKYEGAMRSVTDKIAADLEKNDVEVLVDDRNERIGIKFNDADLIGIPFRVVVGEKNLALEKPLIEVKRRGEQEAKLIPVDSAVNAIAGMVFDELLKLG